MKFGRCGLPELAATWTPEQIMIVSDAIIELSEEHESDSRAPQGSTRVSGEEMFSMLAGMN